MPTIKGAFIDPAVLLGKVQQPTKTPIVAGLALGPSAPHDDDDHDDDDAPAAPAPPLLGADTSHYVEVLDQIWPEFDQPEERTAARLQVLFDRTVDEASRMNLAVQDFLQNTPNHKVPYLDRVRLHTEFVKYLKRLNGYRVRLAELPPESTDTQSVYIGLVQTRPGAGVVPDAIMHLYFRNQLGVFAEHERDMSQGFVARVLDGLADLRDFAIEKQDEIRDAKKAAIEESQKWRWVIGAAIGAAVVTVLGVLGISLARGSDRPS